MIEEIKKILNSDDIHYKIKLRQIKKMNIKGTAADAIFINILLDEKNITDREKIHILSNLFIENNGKKLDLEYVLHLF